MLAKMIDKIVSLKETKIFEIDGQTYADASLTRIPPHVDRPDCISVSGLDSICKLIRTELEKVGTTIMVQVKSNDTVEVMTTYLSDFSRNTLYRAKADAPGLRTGFRGREVALIELRSLCIPNEGTAYLLDLLSRMTNENSVSTNDNGVTQTVEARQGPASCCGRSAPSSRWSSPRASSCCAWIPTRGSASSRLTEASGSSRPRRTSPTTS